jgi:Flp pilus assembly pilin Flp
MFGAVFHGQIAAFTLTLVTATEEFASHGLSTAFTARSSCRTAVFWTPEYGIIKALVAPMLLAVFTTRQFSIITAVKSTETVAGSFQLSTIPTHVIHVTNTKAGQSKRLLSAARQDARRML